MNRNALKNLLAAATIGSGVAVAVAGGAGTAIANPIHGHYVEDARGDSVPGQMLTYELGDSALFPLSEGLVYHDHRDSSTVVPDDGIANDWTVHIENVSGRWWTNLFFVADVGATIGNADGIIEDMSGAPGVMTDAFRIDASGVNANLMSESITADGILEPGEGWEFRVSNFGTCVNSRPPQLTTPGVFAGSSPMAAFGGNSSIVATPLPEPSSMLLLTIAGCALLARRRGSSRNKLNDSRKGN